MRLIWKVEHYKRCFPPCINYLSVGPRPILTFHTYLCIVRAGNLKYTYPKLLANWLPVKFHHWEPMTRDYGRGRKDVCLLTISPLSASPTLHLCPPGNSPSSIPKALLSHSDLHSGLLLKACAAQTVILLQVGNTTAMKIKHQFSEEFIGFPAPKFFLLPGSP